MKSVKCHNSFFQFFPKVTLILMLLVSVFANAQKIDNAKQEQGKKLFKQCAACHKLDKPLVGPPLGKVAERRSKEWLYKWVRNSAELIKSEDKDAVEVFNKWNKITMPGFPQLKDEELDAIIYYTTVGEVQKKVKEKKPVVEDVKVKAPEWLSWVLLLTVFVAVFVLCGLFRAIGKLKGRDGNVLSMLWGGLKQNKLLLLLFTIFGSLISIYVIFGTLFKVGVDQGYKPVQPILFSHKIHAGDNKINCEYCHVSAKRSKHSGIPATNICMNCHKNISEVAEDTKVVLEDRTVEKTDLDKEIAKLYNAVGWNAKDRVYTGKTKNIEWVRVHNLPDFAYYNHSQHVTVAGIKCQKCHGPVETMEEVYQFSPLTMGWCIDCHKETEVNLKGNAYYAKIHKQLAEKYGIDKVTIAQLGGKECGKCHY